MFSAFFNSRLLVDSLDCAAVSSICHSPVATGSLQPKILASQRMLVALIPFSFWPCCMDQFAVTIPLSQAPFMRCERPLHVPIRSSGREHRPRSLLLFLVVEGFCFKFGSDHSFPSAHQCLAATTLIIAGGLLPCQSPTGVDFGNMPVSH